MSTTEPMLKELQNRYNFTNQTTVSDLNKTSSQQTKTRYSYNVTGNNLASVSDGKNSTESMLIFYGIPALIVFLVLLVVLIRICMFRSKASKQRKIAQIKEEISKSDTLKTVVVNEQIA